MCALMMVFVFVFAGVVVVVVVVVTVEIFLGILKGETVNECKGIKWTFKPGQEIKSLF
jgi:hypothetical protein